MAGDIADGLVGRGWAVVSGAAYGIDAASHRAALAADGPTVAVLACGADRAYPSAHRGLLDAVARTARSSARSRPGARLRSRFLARNRIIAALARATVVVEASLRSGSLTTAREARDLDLPVGAVPGPVTSMASAGCHALLRETDAVLVTDAAEVAELAGHIGEDLAVGEPERPRAHPEDDLDAAAYGVWSAVPVRGGVTPTGWPRRPECPLTRLVGVLAALEAEGLVTREPGGGASGGVAARRRAGGGSGATGTRAAAADADGGHPWTGAAGWGTAREPTPDLRVRAVIWGPGARPAVHRGTGRRVSVV